MSEVLRFPRRSGAERQPTAIVIGAGVAGLAAAVGLHDLGWAVEVHERAESPRDTGTGLGLTPNGLRAAEVLGVADAVRAVSVVQTTGGVRRADGSWVSCRSLDFLQERFGHPTVAVHRGEMLAALARRLPEGWIRWGSAASAVAGDGPGPGEVVSGGGGYHRSDLVVAADGIRSASRAALFPAHAEVRPAGAGSWRFVVGGRDGTDVAAETWGAGVRVSLLPLTGGRVHCSVLTGPPTPAERSGGPEALRARIGHWHAPIPELLDAVDPADMVCRDIEELRAVPPAYHRGRVVLLGDAAHAMTPNLGSANLALEDAATLVRLVARWGGPGGVPGALKEHTDLRRPRTAALARRSRRIGQVAQLSHPAAGAARELAVRAGGLLPVALVGRSLDFFMGWQPPGRDPAPAGSTR